MRTDALLLASLLGVSGCCDLTSGCSDPAILSCLAAFDPWCSAIQFDQQCLNEAQDACGLDCAIQPDECDPCAREVTPDNDIEVDYLIVGAGPAGLATAADLTAALKAIGEDSATVAVVEASDRLGGRYHDWEVVRPDDYTGPVLKVPLGAARYNPNTMHLLRAGFNHFNIPSYCSIFNNHITARGRSRRCGAPSACDIFSPFCANEPTFVDSNQTSQQPIGSAFQDIPSVGDPEAAAYEYIIGYESVNPATGLECDNADPDISKKCPAEACKHYPDWRAFLAGVLGREYGAFMSAGNVGFFGDQARSFEACEYIKWFTREYDTLAINCYPQGGMSSLTDAYAAVARQNGAVIYTNEPAICINNHDSGSGSGFVVKTTTKNIRVKQFLFVAVDPYELKAAPIQGDVMEAITAMPAFSKPKATSVITVNVQWDPNVTPFWAAELLSDEGTYSYRQWGDIECFARFEVQDTPYHRQHHAIKVVYTDHKCERLWTELIKAGDAALTAEIMRGLRNLFPDISIPEPLQVKGTIWDAGWYFTDPSARDISIQQLLDFATQPLPGSNVCLMGDAYNPTYSAWSEGAYITSRNCLMQFTENQALLEKLREIHQTRDAAVAPFDNFDAFPGADGFAIGPSESFAPFGCLYTEDGSLKEFYTAGVNCGNPQCAAGRSGSGSGDTRRKGGRGGR